MTREQIVNRFVVPYKKGRNFFKKVYLYQINIDSLGELELTNEVVDKSQLQLEEVDWAEKKLNKKILKENFKGNFNKSLK